MKNFEYFAPTKIIFGLGTISRVGGVAAEPGKRALLVTGSKSSAVASLCAKVKESLTSAGVEVTHFDGVIPNPTTDVVTAGAMLAKEHKCDLVIGLGGGSSMDVAKAIAVEATHPGTA